MLINMRIDIRPVTAPRVLVSNQAAGLERRHSRLAADAGYNRGSGVDPGRRLHIAAPVFLVDVDQAAVLAPAITVVVPEQPHDEGNLSERDVDLDDTVGQTCSPDGVA